MSETTKPVGETISLFIKKLSESTGYKYLKSRALKKTVGPIVFEVLFHSSQWNGFGIIDINVEFCVSYKKYGPVSTVHSVIANKSLNPIHQYYYDISTEDKFNEIFKLLDKKLHETAVDLSNRFENDFNEACKYLLDEKFYEYDVSIDFLVDMLGEEAVLYRIHEMIEALTDVQKQQIIDYKNGAKNKNWMLNRCNLRYIVDKGYI